MMVYQSSLASGVPGMGEGIRVQVGPACDGSGGVEQRSSAGPVAAAAGQWRALRLRAGGAEVLGRLGWPLRAWRR